jgi:serine phosphatase RsbU (regulator of sigma subunit)
MDTVITRDSVIDITQTKLDTTKTNISFDGKWKYHPGDDTTWAEINYNDSAWNELNNNFQMDSIESGTWNGIGWFRKTFIIDSTMFNKPVAFIVNQKGASEFYLNGKLVKTFGTINKDIEKEETYNPQKIPFTVVLDTSKTQELAIRYANNKAQEYYERYNNSANFAGFTLEISSNNRAISSKVINVFSWTILWTTIGAITFAFALLHLLIFVFYSRERENLFYGLFAGSITLWMVALLFSNNTHSVFDFFYIVNMSILIWMSIVFATYTFSLYAIFYKKMPKQFWVILILGAVMSVMVLFVFTENWFRNYIFAPFILLLTAEGLRVIILAVKREKRNAFIIGTGVLIFFLFVMYIPISVFFSINTPAWFVPLLLSGGLLSLPISMSIYLARESARTKIDLENRIVEVQNLSEKAIERERKSAKIEAENDRKTKELEEARQLQLSMLPKELPKIKNLDIAVYMKTATEVGGDYYDFAIATDGTLNVGIGDATGHGMQAGTIVTLLKGLFTSEVSKKDLLTFLRDTSNAMKGIELGRLMMAFSLLRIKENLIQFSSAGMPPMYIYRNGSKIVEEINMKGMPLGAIKNFEYKLHEAELKSGDCILLLSDGYPELENNKNEQIGYERLKEQFAEVAEKHANEIIQYFKNNGSAWVKDADPDDDVTFVVLKVK